MCNFREACERAGLNLDEALEALRRAEQNRKGKMS